MDVIRLTAKPAHLFCRLFTLSAEAGRLLDEKQTLLVYLYRLMNERLFVDAVRLLAHALPRQDGIRWAGDCARNGASSAAASAALTAVEAWLGDPGEPNRRACGAAATAAGCATAAGSAALAVFLSGGNIAPADRPAACPANTWPRGRSPTPSSWRRSARNGAGPPSGISNISRRVSCG